MQNVLQVVYSPCIKMPQCFTHLITQYLLKVFETFKDLSSNIRVVFLLYEALLHYWVLHSLIDTIVICVRLGDGKRVSSCRIAINKCALDLYLLKSGVGWFN